MTFRIITRGAPREVRKDFCCPVHGYFIALVDSNAESAPCPVMCSLLYAPKHPCGESSPWSPRSAPAMRMRRVEAVRGNHEKPQHKGWLDTSNLEEGQDFDDWQADREAVHEELRKDLVMEMVRSDR